MMAARNLLVLFFLLPVSGWAQLFVAPAGNDTASGSKDSPLATMAMALRKAREWRRLNEAFIENGIHIYVGGGNYSFSEPLFLRPEDAGTANSPTIIEALPGELPVFSGGREIAGWRKLNKKVKNLPAKAIGNVWVATVPDEGGTLSDFRQLWVAGKKAVRAKHINDGSMARILSWNKKTEQCVIPRPAVELPDGGGLEMMIHQWWAVANLRVKTAVSKGDSTVLSFHQPESRIQSEHPWPAPWLSSETGNSAFVLSNALAFLDSPGEWFFDKQSRQLYYWPRPGEDLRTATVVVPALESVVRIEGTADRPVTNIFFKGISFQHTTWLRPSQQGHVPLQAGMYLLDAYKLKIPGTPEKKSLENQAWVGRPAAAVTALHARTIGFQNCSFLHTAATALDFGEGVQNSRVAGNLFQDVGGTAILAGVFSQGAMEAHLPYNPTDKRLVTSEIIIADNVVNHVANEDWGCVGIGAGYVKNSIIMHNDVSEVPYTGISLGWGWSPLANVMQNNRVTANRIYRYGKQLYDVAAIYTLGAQPGTLISDNYIDSIYKAPYAHLPSHWFYLYTDEGTAGVTVSNNWTPTQKYLQNANGPGNVWENNGPVVGASIKATAGVRPPYRHWLHHREVPDAGWPINHELPVAIELVAKTVGDMNLVRLKEVLAANGVNPAQVYQWQNHSVVYDKVQDVSVLRSRLQKAFPAVMIKVYDDVFYEFNRQGCGDSSVAEWDHILLTANLVKNTALQNEYLAGHKTQFKKWPEVSAGFCRAGFQQLLLYKNGRQLMLVISIPKGESLDNLNPKTMENNPRVVEWNNRMRKYQEGINGTKPGDVWVQFEKTDR